MINHQGLDHVGWGCIWRIPFDREHAGDTAPWLRHSLTYGVVVPGAADPRRCTGPVWQLGFVGRVPATSQVCRIAGCVKSGSYDFGVDVTPSLAGR